MNEDVKQRWTAALRSGEFRQGVGALHRNHIDTGEAEYCCLGVLCELAIRDGVVIVIRQLEPVGERPIVSVIYDGYGAFLPEAVQRWADLQDNDPTITDLWSLSAANDNGMPFVAIADLIEERL